MTNGVQTRILLNVGMLKIIAASSLYNSLKDLQNSLLRQLQEDDYAGFGLRLSSDSVIKSKVV